MNHRIYVVDDHKVVLEGLREIIRHEPSLTLERELQTGQAACQATLECPPDLLILDIALPDISGLEVIKQLRGAGCTVPILVFSMYPAEQYLPFVRRLGAQGFLGKDASAGEITQAIAAVSNGQTYFPRAEGSLGALRPMPRLSQRELSVMQGLLRGKTQTEIAAELGITNKTIGTYRNRILEKFGVDNNAELIAIASKFAEFK